MFLKVFNAIAIIKLYNTGNYYPIRTDGTNTGTPLSYNNSPLTFTSRIGENSKATGTWMVIGDGNTPVNETDYKLANAINSGYNLSNPIIVNPANNESVPSVTYTVVNTSTDDLTIKETGLVYGNSSSYVPILICREVLPTPIVIPPSGKHTFSFNFIA